MPTSMRLVTVAVFSCLLVLGPVRAGEEASGKMGFEESIEIYRQKREKELAVVAASDPENYPAIATMCTTSFSGRMSILADRDMVVFCQPDGSLTVLDAETGKVRRRFYSDLQSYGLRFLFDAADYLSTDRLIIGINNPIVIRQAGFILDRKTGDLLYSPVYGTPLFFGDIVTFHGATGVFSLNPTTHARKLIQATQDIRNTSISPFFLGSSAKIGDNLVTLTQQRDIQLLSCHNPVTSKQLWQKSNASPGVKWAGILAHDEKIYLFTAKKKSSPFQEEWKEIVVFSANGKELESLEPAPDLFGGSLPFYFPPRRFLGEDTNESTRLLFLAEIPDQTTKDLGFYPVNSKITKDGAIFGIGDNAGEFIIYCWKDGHYWKVKSNCLKELEAFRKFFPLPLGAFEYDMNEKYLVYISMTGQVECLDRATGESKWVYLFRSPSLFGKIDDRPDSLSIPRASVSPSELSWKKDSFLMDSMAPFYRYADTHTLKGAGPVASSSGGATVPVIVDPKPFSDDGIGRAPFLVWLIPLLSLAFLVVSYLPPVLAYIHEKHEKNGWGPGELIFPPIIRASVVVWMNFRAFEAYGRYSYASSLFMAFCAFAAMGSALVEIRRLWKKSGKASSRDLSGPGEDVQNGGQIDQTVGEDGTIKGAGA